MPHRHEYEYQQHESKNPEQDFPGALTVLCFSSHVWILELGCWSFGFFLCHVVLCSYPCAICKIRASSSGFPSTCNPIRSSVPSPDIAKPHERLIPHIPAEFTTIENTSAQ